MPTQSPLFPLYLDVLRSIAVALGQMNIYRVGHPAVAKAIKDTHQALGQALDKVEKGEIIYAVSEGKLLANGEPIGALNQIPNAVTQIFNRFRIGSLALKKGITEAEVTALCEMAATKSDDSKNINAGEFIAHKGATHIGVNEKIYTAITEGEAVVDKGAAGGGGGGSEGPSVSEQLRDRSLEESLQELIKMAVPDPVDRSKVFDLVMARVRSDLENKVREVTAPLERAKTKVENEQVRTESVLTNMAEGVVVVDDQGRVLMMNAAAEEVYGIKLKDIAGQPLSQFLKDEHMLTLSSDIATPEDRALQAKIDVKAKNDTLRTLRASTAIVQNEAGKTVGMVSAISDVAKHKELDRMEREFVAHVTHELRAPLSSIRASLEILQGEFTGKLDSDQSRMLNTALKNADRLDDLIRNILDFSKIESGQMSVYPKPIEPAKIAQEAVESMQPWCQKKGLKLVLEAADNLPKVSADSGRIIQVLVNLLSNAIKFSPQSGQITVRVAKGAGRYERFISFAVKDQGPGIPKEETERIFEKFVQIAAGEKNIAGTGLGLAIAKALVLMHNGHLWVESEVGKGAAFNFTLPIYVAEAEAMTAPTPAPAPKAKAPWWKRLFGGG